MMIADKLKKTKAEYDAGITTHLYHLDTSEIRPDFSILDANDRDQILNDIQMFKHPLEQHNFTDDVSVVSKIFGLFLKIINENLSSNDLKASYFQEFKHTLYELDQLGQDNQTSLEDTKEGNIAPASQTLTFARQFVTRFYKLLKFYDHQFKKPHISIDVDGEVSFTWWYKNKSLSFYIYPSGELYFLKVWGPNIHNDMDDGTNPTDLELIDLWRWLKL